MTGVVEKQTRANMLNDDRNSDLAAILHELHIIVAQGDADPRDNAARAQAGLRAYEDARFDGLCHDGAWEAALEALRRARATHH